MSVFEEIKKGLEQAIAYNDGKLQARKTEISTNENCETNRIERIAVKDEKKK